MKERVPDTSGSTLVGLRVANFGSGACKDALTRSLSSTALRPSLLSLKGKEEITDVNFIGFTRFMGWNVPYLRFDAAVRVGVLPKRSTKFDISPTVSNSNYHTARPTTIATRQWYSKIPIPQICMAGMSANVTRCGGISS